MPIYFFWGEDDYAIASAIEQLQQTTLDPAWQEFNHQRLSGDREDTLNEALDLALTPPFGTGGRLICLEDTTVTQHASDTAIAQLERTLPLVPETTTLILTSGKKPDKRLKSSKILAKYAQIREFSLIPPWKTQELLNRLRQVARDCGVALTPEAIALLNEAVGNNTRQQRVELEKLALFAKGQQHPLSASQVAALVSATTHNSVQLANAIRNGDRPRVLSIVQGLHERNEPPLRIVATLIGQFRTWLWVKLMEENGEPDEKAIAAAAAVGNPKRIYFLRREIESLSLGQLLETLPILLELEVSLKRGADPQATLQMKALQLCQICRGISSFE